MSAPFWASSRHTARPMSRAPPVTRATLFERSKDTVSSLVAAGRRATSRHYLGLLMRIRGCREVVDHTASHARAPRKHMGDVCSHGRRSVAISLALDAYHA